MVPCENCGVPSSSSPCFVCDPIKRMTPDDAIIRGLLSFVISAWSGVMASREYEFMMKYDVAGDHVHCTLFSRAISASATWINIGNITTRRGSEFVQLYLHMPKAVWIPAHGVSFERAAKEAK